MVSCGQNAGYGEQRTAFSRQYLNPSLGSPSSNPAPSTLEATSRV